MRYLFAVLILAAFAACSPSESLPTACSPACAAGQVCINAQCLAPVDGGGNAADVPGLDVAVDAQPVDVAADAADVVDAVAVDAQPDVVADVAPEAAVDVAVDALVCPMGFADCDGMAVNGCETDTRTNFNHCGGCGMRCLIAGDGTPTCTLGSCGVACGANQGNCDRMFTNGCEVDLQRDRYNCGACGHFCGAQSCVMGACR